MLTAQHFCILALLILLNKKSCLCHKGEMVKPRGDFRQFSNNKSSYLRPLLSNTFPQGFRISKNIRHPTSGSGGKKTIKKDRKPKKTEKSEEKNFFLRGGFRQFLNKNFHI